LDGNGDAYPRWQDPCASGTCDGQNLENCLEGCVYTDQFDNVMPAYLEDINAQCTGPFYGCLNESGAPCITVPDGCCCEYCDIPCFTEGSAPPWIDVTIADVVKQTWVSNPPFCTTVPNPAPAAGVNGTWRCDYIGTFAGGCYYQYGPISLVTITIYLYTDGSIRILAQYDGWTQYDYQPATWDCGTGPYDGETCIQYNTDIQCTADCGNYYYEDGQTATLDNVVCPEVP
jgi:hypothetical protein